MVPPFAPAALDVRRLTLSRGNHTPPNDQAQIDTMPKGKFLQFGRGFSPIWLPGYEALWRETQRPLTL
jgi:hypothetical protein